MGKKKVKVASEKPAITTQPTHISSTPLVRYWDQIYLEKPLEELELDKLEAIQKILNDGKSGAKTQLSHRGQCIVHKQRGNKKARFVFASFENGSGKNLVLVEKIDNHKFSNTPFYGETSDSQLMTRVLNKVNHSKSYALDESFFNRLETCLQKRRQEAKSSVEDKQEETSTIEDENNESEEQIIKDVYFFDHKLIALNSEQIEFHQFLKKNYKDIYNNFPLVITGPAGSGKTTVALVIAEKMLQQLLEDRQSQEKQKTLRFLFVCKSKGLSETIAKMWKESGLCTTKDMTFDFLTYKELLKLEDPLLQDEQALIDENSSSFTQGKSHIKVLLKDGKATFEKWLKSYIDHQHNDELNIFYIQNEAILYQELKICLSCKSDREYCELGNKSHSLITKALRGKVVDIKDKYKEYLEHVVSVTPIKHGQMVVLQPEDNKPSITIKAADAAQFIKNHPKVNVSLVDASLQPLQATSSLYDVVILDEGQDLGQHQIAAIKKLCDPRNGEILIINKDHNQSVGEDTVIANSNLPFAHQTLYLHKSERSPQAVTQFSQEILSLKSNVVGGQIGQLEKIIKTETNDPIENKQQPQNNKAIYWLKQDDFEKSLPKEALPHFEKSNRKMATIVMTEEMKAKLKQENNQQRNIYTPEEIKGLEFNYVLYYPFHGKEAQWLKIYKSVEEDIKALKNSGKKHLELKPYLTRFNHIDRESVILLNEFFTAITRTKIGLVIIQSNDQRLNELIQYFSACIDDIQLNAKETPWGDPEMSVDDWRNDYKSILKKDYNEEDIVSFSKQLELAVNDEKDPEKKNALNELLDSVKEEQQTPKLIKFIQSDQEQKIRLLFQDDPNFDLLKSFQVGKKAYHNYIEYIMQCGEKISINIVKMIALHAGKHLLTTTIKQNTDASLALFLFSWIQKNNGDSEEIIDGLSEAAIEIEKKSKPGAEWIKLGKLLNEYLQELKKKHSKNTKTESTTSSLGLFSQSATPKQLPEQAQKYILAFIQPLLKKTLTVEEKQNFSGKMLQLFKSGSCKQYLQAIVEIGTQKLTLKDALLNNAIALKLLCELICPENEGIMENILFIGFNELITSIEKLIPKKGKADYFSRLLALLASKPYQRLLDSEEIVAKTYTQIFKTLTSGGADVDYNFDVKMTPISIAVTNGNDKIVNLFIPRSKNAYYIYLLNIAAKHGHLKIAQLFLEKDTSAKTDHSLGTTLGHAAFNGQVEIVKLLIKHNADLNHINENGGSPIYVAAQNGHVKVVELLLNNGVNVNWALKNAGATSLFIAAQNGHAEVVRLLLAKGANNQRRLEGDTPFHIALQIGQLEVLKVFIEHNSNFIEDPLSDGARPLFCAAQHGHIEIVKCLLLSGADMTALFSKSVDGLLEFAKKYKVTKTMTDFINKHPGERIIKMTALDIAEIMGNTEIAEILKNHKPAAERRTSY